jgi:hypothetical protein
MYSFPSTLNILPQNISDRPYLLKLAKNFFSAKQSCAIGKYNLVSIDKKQEFDRHSLLIIQPQEKKFLKNKGYNWKEVHKIKSPLGNKVLKLIEVN